MDPHPTRSATGGHTLLPAFAARAAAVDLLDLPAVPTKAFLRWTFGRDTVIWRLWPAVLLHTCFAAAVVSVSMKTQYSLDVPPVLLTVLGVVIGFVISYRAMSGYDRYWMGRTVWSDVLRNSRTLSRLIWFHVPLRLAPEDKDSKQDDGKAEAAKQVMAEKRLSLDLIEAFCVSLKHHLRGEGGIYYEDLYPLVKSLYQANTGSHHHQYHSDDHRHGRQDHAAGPPANGHGKALTVSRTASPTPPIPPSAPMPVHHDGVLGVHPSHQSTPPPPPNPIIPPINTYGPSPSTSPVDPSIPPINAYGTFLRDSHAPSASSSSRTSSCGTQGERRPLLPSAREREHGMIASVSSDLVPFASAWTALGHAFTWPARAVRGWAAARGQIELPQDWAERGSDASDVNSDTGGDPEALAAQGGVQRRAGRVDAPRERGRKRRPRVAGAGGNVPLAIVRSLSAWMAVLEGRGAVPGTSLGSMLGCLGTYEECLSALEKILTTPLPFVYAVHIRTVWIYLFFLPFQLISQFGWWTIPGVGMAAFIYLGFVAAGEEIEQPFGYDENDLDLDMFCHEVVHADLARLRRTPCANVFLGAHQAPREPASAQGWPSAAFAHIFAS